VERTGTHVRTIIDTVTGGIPAVAPVPWPRTLPPSHIHVLAPRMMQVPTVAPVASASAFAAAHSALARAWSVRARATTFAPEVVAATPLARRSGDLLDALAQYGYTNLSVDNLIALRDHGVSGSLIAGATAFFGHPSVADLIRLADHGVYGSYLAELRSAGISGLSPDDAIRIRDHGVSPMLIAGLRSRGYSFNADTLVKLADHGVSIMYIDSMQRLRSNGRPSLDDIIRLHDAGFTP